VPHQPAGDIQDVKPHGFGLCDNPIAAQGHLNNTEKVNARIPIAIQSEFASKFEQRIADRPKSPFSWPIPSQRLSQLVKVC